MKARRLIGAGTALLLLSTAGLVAQDSLPEPQRPRARRRMHTPGTGRQPGMTPMQRRQGATLGVLSRDVADGRVYSPRALLAQREFLGLSVEQVAELERLHQSVEAAHERALEQGKTRQERLSELWKVDQPDVDAIRRESQELMKARQDAWLAGIDATARAKATLTAEQLGKVQGLAQGRRMVERRRAMGMRRAPRMRGGMERGRARGFAPRHLPRRP